MEWYLPAADDFHVHLRKDARTPIAIRAVRSGGVGRALIMPNTDPPILTVDDVTAYVESLRQLGADFDLLMTIKLRPDTTPDGVLAAHRGPVVAGKLYPQGVTTHSDDGFRDIQGLYPVFEAMQQCDMVLSIHGEQPEVFVLDAERAFLPSLKAIVRNFPRLRIVLEHITTQAAVEAVCTLPDTVAATITDHHLAITLHDVVGSRLQPHHFCMPVAKRPSDQKALLDVIRQGHPRFFSGTDSAPHFRQHKESASGCAGVFSSAFHMPILATLFSQHEMMDQLQPFCCERGAAFYKLAPPQGQIVIQDACCRVPEEMGGVVPFFAGHELPFSVAWVD